MKNVFLILSLYWSLQAFAETHFSVTEDSVAVGGRIFLPCSFGSCMLDTAGQTTLLGLNPKTAAFPKVGQRVITSLNGVMNCDVLAPLSMDVAGKNFPHQTILRCPDPAIDPMLGLDILSTNAFEISFTKTTLTWLEKPIQNPTAHLESARGWIAFPADLGGQIVHVVYDTGTPLTMVDSTIVAAHPELFTVSDLVPESSFVPRDKVFQLKQPLKVGEFLLDVGLVQSVDLKTVFKSNDFVPDIFLGYNSMKKYDWSFDLQEKIFLVNNR
jgi:hypothetical protein